VRVTVALPPCASQCVCVSGLGTHRSILVRDQECRWSRAGNGVRSRVGDGPDDDPPMYTCQSMCLCSLTRGVATNHPIPFCGRAAGTTTFSRLTHSGSRRASGGASEWCWRAAPVAAGDSK
jgi:hypothetical protein